MTVLVNNLEFLSGMVFTPMKVGHPLIYVIAGAFLMGHLGAHCLLFEAGIRSLLSLAATCFCKKPV